MSQITESKILTFYRSQTGRKFITGITGIGLMGFLVVHLAGNLGFFIGADAVNAYTAKLHSLGPLVVIVEIGLIAIVLFHAILGISIAQEKKKARPEGYAMHVSGGTPSRMSPASKSMIWTGTVLLLFLILHVWQFRFGPHYDTMLPGGVEPVRDMYKVVVDVFANPLWVAVYMGVMVLLGFHLRHGFWSAFQSIGVMSSRLSNTMYVAALFFAVLIALGFFVLPLYLNLMP
ncbi:MAG: succinate dehydrogenase cytochrome b subunit [Rhodothermia bacterium]|nr:succinate dehydrogenase cytochrome b subunit [Rhodothermia bacterium]